MPIRAVSRRSSALTRPLRAVQGAAAAALGTEGLVTQRVVDHADEAAVGVLERDAHAPGGEAVEVVDRAVERVDDPAPAAVPARSEPSSPSTPSSGRSCARRSRMAASEALSASDTRSVATRLLSTSLAGPP